MKVDHTEDKVKEFVSVMAQLRQNIMKSQFGFNASKSATSLQFHGLVLISNFPGLTVGELADKVKMSSAAVAQYLSRLETAKLVEKRQDTQDKRVSRIYLTEEGEKSLKQTRHDFYKKAKDVLSVFTEAELSTYIELNKKLLSEFETS